MSAKWVRSQQWEREHLTGWLTPVRWVLHALSTVRLAIVLLVGLSIFGALASVPIGMLALIPTYLIYGLTLLAAIALFGLLPSWLAWRTMKGAGLSSALRFGLIVPVVIAGVLGATALWMRLVWPWLHHDPLTGEGLRLFGPFVDRYRAETVRRLPGMEMSELEFYAWWPLNALLILFVVNMVVTTVRRIEFRFENLGVLTVHAGIVVLALGSAYYATFKQEGDVLLTAGPLDAAKGVPSLGPAESGFFDNTATVLRVRQLRSTAERLALKIPPELDWEQRLLSGVPRYNAYNLGAAGATLGRPAGADAGEDAGRTLNQPVMRMPVPRDHGPLVDPDIALRVVGYAPYVELMEDWREGEPSPGQPANPLQQVVLLSALSETAGDSGASALRPIRTFGLAPLVPAERVADLGEAVSIEALENAPTARWEELKAPLPEGARHGLIVELPGAGVSRVYGVREGQRIVIAPGGGDAPGASSWTITVRQVLPEPPFAIITPGYRGATSSVLVVRVEPPAGATGADGAALGPFERYVYSRYPELNQDLVDAPAGSAPGAAPKRRGAEPALRLTYVDATRVQVYLDHRPEGTVRSLMRVPGRAPVERAGLKAGDKVEIGPMVQLQLGARVAHAERVAVPAVVPTSEREKDAIGNHKRAALAVEVSVGARDGGAGTGAWSRTIWLPFRQYYGLEQQEGAQVRLPDGRVIEIAFGRLWRPLPGMALRLAEFEMIPYPHSTQARDFRSDLIVTKWTGAEGDEVAEVKRSTSLNEPLLESPHVWRADAPVRSALSWAGSMLGASRYKFSQSGWDPTGWNQTKARADRGELPKPSARFTILGVGNNPGIYVIALGSVMVALGTPWAFYVKPWLLRRRKAKIMADLAAGAQTGAGGARAHGKPSLSV
jgi:hypothetical protein